MNKKIKLLTTIPLTTITVLAPFAITACNPTKKDDSTKPNFKKMNFSKITSIKDINAVSEGVVAMNTDPYHPFNLKIGIPQSYINQGGQIQFQTGSYSGEGSIDWDEATGWIKYEYEGTHKDGVDIPATKPIRLRAITNDGGILSDKDNVVQFVFDGAPNPGTGLILAGNAASLIGKIGEYGTFGVPTDLPAQTGEYIFYKSFSSSNVYKISSNFLPFKTMRAHCYDSMFMNSNNITQVPALPSISLAESCYENMFAYCGSLTVAPHLPARELVKNCYKTMFYECHALKSLSLSYIGNFLHSGENTYFHEWVKGIGKAMSKSPGGAIHYNGCDVERGESAIPETFTITQDKALIADKTCTVTVQDDQSWSEGGKTCTLPVNAKKQVRVWKDTSIADMKPHITAPTSSFSTFRTLKYCDTQTHEPLDETTKITVDTTFDLSYFQGKFVADPTVVNIQSGFTAAEEAQDPENNITRVTITPNGSSPVLYYRTNSDKEWEPIQIASTKTLEIHADDGIQIKGSIDTSNYDHYTNIKITGKASLVGSAWSLIMTGDKGELVIPDEMPDYAFYSLFEGSTGITSVSENFLFKPNDPKGTTYDLKKMCYNSMFSGCTNLVGSYDENGDVIPMVIPMKENISTACGCCEYMFYHCSSLLKAPELPATTVPAYILGDDGYGHGGYDSMFEGCTNLTHGPSILPATTVPFLAYDRMFYECSSLISAPKILVETADKGYRYSGGWVNSSLAYMFYGCSSLETAPEMKKVKDVGQYAMYSMFKGCDHLKDASNITLGQMNAGQGTLTLKEACFEYMFMDCIALEKAPNLLGISTYQNAMVRQERYYCYKMFYNTNLDVASGKDSDPAYVKFFTGFDLKNDSSSAGSMFKRGNNSSWTPQHNVTYYYKLPE